MPVGERVPFSPRPNTPIAHVDGKIQRRSASPSPQSLPPEDVSLSPLLAVTAGSPRVASFSTAEQEELAQLRCESRELQEQVERLSVRALLAEEQLAFSEQSKAALISEKERIIHTQALSDMAIRMLRSSLEEERRTRASELEKAQRKISALQEGKVLEDLLLECKERH